MPKSTHSTDKPNAGTGPQVTYSEGGRGGTIHYSSSETSFDMWYEFALSPAVVDIGIPESKYWEAQTKTPLSQRETILRYIGEQVTKDKLTGDGYALFNEMVMTIYSGKKPADTQSGRHQTP